MGLTPPPRVSSPPPRGEGPGVGGRQARSQQVQAKPKPRARQDPHPCPSPQGGRKSHPHSRHSGESRDPALPPSDSRALVASINRTALAGLRSKYSVSSQEANSSSDTSTAAGVPRSRVMVTGSWSSTTLSRMESRFMRSSEQEIERIAIMYSLLARKITIQKLLLRIATYKASDLTQDAYVNEDHQVLHML